jgi:4-diphosphocytidyl-2-C-methyl-D-erythritol kinase
MMRVLRHLPAPAKLNLFLHVTGRRADGYHLLETVFQLIDLADTVHLACLPEGRIERDREIPGVPAEDDLTVRAARRLAQASGCRLGVRIGLDKRIPMGGGLGGGSSDAATVLLGLNRLWGLHWPVDALAELALGLGADVPVFVRGHNAYATGIGEALQPIALPARHFVVVAPPQAVPTAGVFSAPELTRNTLPLKLDSLSCEWSGLEGRNDLQPVVEARYPRVAQALGQLRQAAAQSGANPAAVRMSGSGACVFVPVPSAASGRGVVQALSESAPGVQAWLTGSLGRHPLCEWAFRQQ